MVEEKIVGGPEHVAVTVDCTIGIVVGAAGSLRIALQHQLVPAAVLVKPCSFCLHESSGGLL